MSSLSCAPPFQYIREMRVFTQFYRTTWHQFIAILGGHLGLFLGWCGVTVVDWFEFSVRMRKARRRAKKQKVQNREGDEATVL